MVDGDVLRMSEAADIAELLAARFARASWPTKVVLQNELAKTAAAAAQRRAADAASEDDREAAVFENCRWDWWWHLAVLRKYASKMLMLLNVKIKIRLLRFISPPNYNNS